MLGSPRHGELTDSYDKRNYVLPAVRTPRASRLTTYCPLQTTQISRQILNTPWTAIYLGLVEAPDSLFRQRERLNTGFPCVHSLEVFSPGRSRLWPLGVSTHGTPSRYVALVLTINGVSRGRHRAQSTRLYLCRQFVPCGVRVGTCEVASLVPVAEPPVSITWCVTAVSRTREPPQVNT